jgi:hypothetical protein
VDEICLQAETGTIRRTRGETLVDAGFAVLSSMDASQTAAFVGGALELCEPTARGVWAIGADGRRYAMLFNWGDMPIEAEVWGKPSIVPGGQTRMFSR